MSGDCRTLSFSSYFGGTGGGPGATESINSIAIGISGNMLIAGTTGSVDLPVSSLSPQRTFGGGSTDGFVARIRGTLGDVLACSYLGGSGDDGINAIALDYTGYLDVAGYTSSTDFPTSNALQPSNAGGLDAFVAKLDFQRLYYSTYLGGTGNDSANAITVDSLASVYAAGTTGSFNFPVSGSLGTFQGSMISSFVTKISPKFTLALAAQPSYLLDVWHNTGYNGSNVTLSQTTFGNAGDIAIAGDWSNTGRRRLGTFRNGTWTLDMNGNGAVDGSDRVVQFGQAGDLPVVGDWDGTGTLKLGLFRQGTFILDLSGHLSGTPTGRVDVSFPFGTTGDVPVAADWDKSGTTKVGVFRNGQWIVDYNGNRTFDAGDKTYTFGQSGDVPVTGDWSGNGVPKIGIYRQGVWILDYPGYNAMTLPQYIGFGGSGYLPLVM